MDLIFERTYSAMMRKVFSNSPTYIAKTKLKIQNNNGAIRRSSAITGIARMPGSLPAPIKASEIAKGKRPEAPSGGR